MPSSEQLNEYGLDESEISDIQKTFKSVERNLSDSDSGARSEIERLILRNDCSTVEVGLLRFLSYPKEHPQGAVVAVCENDPIVVRGDGTVAMYDHGNPDLKAMDCGADSERFLDALAAFIDIRRNKLQWKGRVTAAAEVCSQLAGGPAYLDFFRLLCGFL